MALSQGMLREMLQRDFSRMNCIAACLARKPVRVAAALMNRGARVNASAIVARSVLLLQNHVAVKEPRCCYLATPLRPFGEPGSGVFKYGKTAK
jgi:hypothetical protein